MALLNEAERAALTERLAAYQAAERDAHVAYEAAMEPARAGYRAQRGEDGGFRAFTGVRDRQWQIYDEALKAPWADLARGTGPLIGWIVERVEEYRNYAELVLAELADGAGLTDLDNLAEDREWCRAWTDYRDRAVSQVLQEVSS